MQSTFTAFLALVINSFFSAQKTDAVLAASGYQWFVSSITPAGKNRPVVATDNMASALPPLATKNSDCRVHMKIL
jgi:hypothetical protein